MLGPLPIRRSWQSPWQNPWLVDIAVSIALLAVMLASIATRAALPGQNPNNAVTYLTAVTMAVPYTFHRRFPLVAVAVVLISILIYSAGDFAAFPGVNAFVLLFGVALHSERRLYSLISFAATMVVMTAAILIQPDGIVDQATWISTELATVVAWLGGDNLRQRRARWAALRERNEFLEREREERAHKAVIEERLRIARELHDVVAHAMSVIAVQSGVGNHVIGTQPAEAQKALAAIETTSRSVLIEMRRLLEVLRQDDESDPDLVPAPGLHDVPALIRQVADGGVTTGLRIRGAPHEVPAGVDLSAYRIVQEALTNAIKHGGPRANVTLSYTDQDVSIEVTNEGSPGNDRGQYLVTPGHGLIGMRERVAVSDGEFSAQPRPGGGFRVAARLPFRGPPS
jgi:signal transduction histidine kinase